MHSSNLFSGSQIMRAIGLLGGGGWLGSLCHRLEFPNGGGDRKRSARLQFSFIVLKQQKPVK